MLRPIELIFKRGLSAILGFLLPSRPPREAFPKNLQRILVIRQHNQLGDMLCVVPMLRALHAAYPGVRISLMTSPVSHNVMWHNRYLSDTILFDKREFLQGKVLRLGKLISFVAMLRRRGFQIVLVPSTISTSFTSDLLAYLSGAPIRVGAASLNGRANPSAFFFNVPVELDWREQPHRHHTLRNMDILAGSGISTPDLSLDIALDEDEERAGKSFVDKLKPGRALVIGYHPGAGKAPNRWPAERFAELIDLVAGRIHATALVTCGPIDKEQVEDVQRAVKTPIEISRNHPIRQLASILRHLDLYITNDTGLMHVAAGVGVPVLSLFGPTDPEQWAPIGRQNRYIRGEGGDITNISVEQVFAASMDMLVRPILSEERK
jgi:ADP-heptose:LPS heptosyltransferase